jgi:hypothetical protein
MAAEDILHDLGAISMIGSDSQAMGRIGEVVLRTWQTAHCMKRRRGTLAGDGAADNHRVRRWFVEDGRTCGCPATVMMSGCVAAAGALGVVRVDRSPGDGGERRLDESGFVQRVGVDGRHHAGRLAHAQACVDRGRGRAPVLV